MRSINFRPARPTPGRALGAATLALAVLAATGTALAADGSARVGTAGVASTSSAADGTTSDVSFPGHHPVVRTDKGRVRGTADAMVTSFKGIPYAKAPVGSLRWKSPRPAARWSGVRDATSFGGSCVQGTGWDPGYEEPTLNEDCLYLNVYRPSNARGDRLPVFVWNHGGGNVGGAGRDTNPDKFLTRSDVVYVTINYRLGAMGWLDTTGLERANRDGSTGNFGLLDQQAALRWVKRNIGSFGGDPRNVTLAGQSAGASNTCAQMASPRATGLFQRAVMDSGGCSARDPRSARESGARFADQIGCGDTTDQVACLRSKSPAEVLAAQTVVRQSGPVAGGNPVLPRNPLDLLKSGRLTDLPVIIGNNSDERQQSVFGAYDYLGKPLSADQLDTLIGDTYGEDADRVRETYYPVSNFYSPTAAWGTITSDERSCSDLTLRDRMARNTTTYSYEFAEKDGPAFTSIWRLGTDYPFGATHVNELGYLWDYLGTALPFSTEQVALSNQMISYWSSFAEDGRPDVRFAPTWPRYRHQGRIMQFQAPSGQAVTAAAIAEQHHCSLWDEVSPAP